MVSVTILLFALVAARSDQEAPFLRASTAMSLDDFGACFVRSQERDSRAWAFMPTESGGTFTNAGNSSPSAIYWLAFNEARPLSQVRLFSTGTSTDLVKAIDRCR